MSTTTIVRAGATALERPGRAAGRPRRPLHRLLVPLLLVLAGVAVLLYPVLATQFNNVKQHDFAEKYSNQVQAVAPDRLAKGLADARAYNSSISGIPILDPYLLKAEGEPGSSAYQNYKSQLSEFETMARLRVPTASIDLPVYHGTTDAILAKGAGHLYGTSLPVGGVGTHAVLTSHTGMSNATLFDHLTSVKKGDLIYIDVYGDTLAYRVNDIQIVLPTDISLLKPQQGQDLVTLFTCYPYGINDHRLMVTGERVPLTADVAKQAKSASSAFHVETWMWWLLAAAVFGILATIVILLAERRRRRRERLESATASPIGRADEEDPPEPGPPSANVADASASVDPAHPVPQAGSS